MNKLRNILAAIVVLAAFGGSAWRVLSHRQAETAQGKISLRIGHWLLHEGMREAFQEAADDYMRLHPHVTVEQIAVPIRTWPAWLRTQLIGGTAPDITGLLTANEELITRHFLPLTDVVASPNPYNAGTPLEGLPWIDTFVDGMAAMRNTTPTSGDLHSINLQINTQRLFYNRRLLKTVTGSDQPPADYAALRALGDQVARYNREHGRRLVPIASCGPYSQYLFESLLPSQTQSLAIELSPMRNFQVPVAELAALMESGRLTFSETPELRASLSLLRDVSTLMSPGYESRQRDDALFDFLQEHAVMIFAGSWDYAVFAREGKFPVGMMPILLPTRDDPDYGRFVLGSASEANGSPEATLGIVRTSRHPEVALDFLHFLSSHAVAGRFSERSLRTSAIAEIPPPRSAPGLAPRLNGVTRGFMPDFNHFGGRNTNLVFQRNLHLLTSANGSVDAFARLLDTEYPRALRRDLQTRAEQLRRDIRRLDAHLGLLLTQEDASQSAATWTRILETRHSRQLDHHTYPPPDEP